MLFQQLHLHHLNTSYVHYQMHAGTFQCIIRHSKFASSQETNRIEPPSTILQHKKQIVFHIASKHIYK
jgi:hypothetical protein